VLNPSDESLIQSCINGDRQAWDRLILRYERLIYNIPLRAGLSKEDSADVFQDVCLLLMNNLEKLTGDYNVAGWLTTTTRWECLRVLKEKRRTPSFTEIETDDGATPLDHSPSLDPLPLEALLALEEEQTLRNAMEELGESCRRLLTMLYQSEPRPTYAEIARQFDIAEGAVGAKRARCLSTLRKILRQHGF
jgi:RNA polymerase sigma factor (sigma-70 family)